MYNELGINLDLGTEDGFYNHYKTPYIIWANDAARKATGNDFVGDGETVSACFLMDEVFSRCSWGGNEFMKMNRRLLDETDIVSSATGYFYEDGVLTKDASDVLRSYYDDYALVEYYLKSNFKD